jgi:hypothetical protein
MLIKYTATFTLESDIEYPLDMLRYDQCYPIDGPGLDTGGRTASSYIHPRTLGVERLVESGWIDDRNAYNLARWKSFCAPIIHVTKSKWNKATHGWSDPLDVWTAS